MGKKEATAKAAVEVKELDEEEAAKAFEEGDDIQQEEPEDDDPLAAGGDVPEWATIPPGVKMPQPGVQIAFLRIPARWTTNPSKGDRWCMCAPIGETEERLAYNRARGDQVRSVHELAKATIRVIDGHKADWSADLNKPGAVAAFWSGIGAKGRQVVRNYYQRTHTVSEEEALDFFGKHFVNVTVT